jgi:hypothetical protein
MYFGVQRRYIGANVFTADLDANCGVVLGLQRHLDWIEAHQDATLPPAVRKGTSLAALAAKTRMFPRQPK